MRVARIAAQFVLIAVSTLAVAHTHLTKSVPADGSTVSTAPSKFVLAFAEAARLTSLSLQKDAEPARKLTPLPTAAAAEISIPAPPLTAGKYVLSWRAVGDDGHVMPGRITFTVSP